MGTTLLLIVLILNLLSIGVVSATKAAQVANNDYTTENRNSFRRNVFFHGLITVLVIVSMVLL